MTGGTAEGETGDELGLFTEWEDEQTPIVSEEHAIRDRALRLLARREHSRHELERKLRAKGHVEAAIARVLDELTASDLVSDQRTAEAYVTARMRKGYGPRRLRQELHERGVEDDLIVPLLDRYGEDWQERLALVAEKKFGPEAATDRKELARRARFLEYRGFPPDLVSRYLRGDRE